MRTCYFCDTENSSLNRFCCDKCLVEINALRAELEDTRNVLFTHVEALTKAGASSPALDKARKLLVEGPKRVAVYAPVSWFQDRDRSLADNVRLEILDALVALSGK